MYLAGEHCVHAWGPLEVASARCDCFSSHHSIERTANSIHLHLVLDGWKSLSVLPQGETKEEMEVEGPLAAKSQQSVHPPIEMNEHLVPWLLRKSEKSYVCLMVDSSTYEALLC